MKELTDTITTTYDVGGGFALDIVEDKKHNSYSAFLYVDDHDIKVKIHGVKREEMNMEEFKLSLISIIDYNKEQYFGDYIDE